MALSFADDIQQAGQAVEAEYRHEQAEIDLVFAECMLSVSRGIITAEESQKKIDQWMLSNVLRLQAQVERAAELDRLMPLTPVSSPDLRELNSVFQDRGKGERYAALELLEEQAVRGMQEKAESPEHQQRLIYDWEHSTEGAAVLKEKRELWEAASAARPLGTEPVVLEAADDAIPEEVEALEWREKSVRRIMDIREAHPQATPEEMQRHISQRQGEFEEDLRQITNLMHSVEEHQLESVVARLKAELRISESLPDKSVTGSVQSEGGE